MYIRSLFNYMRLDIDKGLLKVFRHVLKNGKIYFIQRDCHDSVNEKCCLPYQ